MNNWAGSALSLLLVAAVGGTVAMTGRSPQPGLQAPRFQDSGLTLTLSGRATGLAPSAVLIRIEAEGLGEAACPDTQDLLHRPRNGIPVYVSRERIYGADEVKERRLDYTISTQSPSVSELPEAACPSGLHAPVLTDVTFQYLTLTVEQDGRPILRQAYNARDLHEAAAAHEAQ